MRRLSFLVALMPAVAYAQTVTVEVRHGSHTVGLSRKEARAVWAAASEQIRREAGVRLRVRRWQWRRMHPTEARSHVHGVLSRLPIPSDVARLKVAMVPRYHYAANYWSAGVAHVCGFSAVVYAGRLSQFVGHELDHARTALVHELGHLLGAKHADDKTLMHPAALGLVHGRWYLPFSEQSISEIAECQKRKG